MLACEIIVTELLPTIRRQTAIFLNSKGFSQRKISEIIDISEAAVSQYLSKKRGRHKGRLEKLISDYIRKHYIISKPFFVNVCSLCTYLRKNGKMCYIHKITSNVSRVKCNSCSMS